MVTRNSIIIAAVVLILGLISVGAGLAGEFTSVKASQIHIENGKCVDENSPAMGLAITAVVALVLMRIVVKVAIGRGYSCYQFHPNVPKLIRWCIVIAWLMSIAAVQHFILGAKHCSSKWVLFTAAFEALVNLVLTLFYYLMVASTQNVPIKPPGSELEASSITEESKKPPLLPQMK